MSTEDNYKKIALRVKEEVEINLIDIKPKPVNSHRTPVQQAYLDGYSIALTLIFRMISELQWENSFEFRIERILNDLDIR